MRPLPDADPPMGPAALLSVGVSIVLYRTPINQIRGLIDQLLAQRVARVYVVDNSADSAEAFRDWVAHERVTLISAGGNLGYGRGNNLAIRQSVQEHKYHLISNPDIALTPHTIESLYDYMEANPQTGLVMPKVVNADGSLQRLCKRSPRPLDYLSGLTPLKGWYERRRARLEMRDCSYEETMEVECLSGCFMFFRSRVLEALGGFDPGFFLYFEDFDLSQRARRMARNAYYPQAAVVHGHARQHRHSWRIRGYFLRSAVRYFNKWGWL
jgi:GT2 family glycosyltransferase